MTIRVGIIGVGRRGLAHLRTLRNFENVTIAAVCDVDKAKLGNVVREYKVKSYLNLDEMLEKERLDAVVICTPVPYHVPQALRCIEKGIHVMIEKPVSTSIKELRELLRAVRSRNVIVAVSFQSKYSRLVDILREKIDRKTLSMVAGYWYWTIPLVSWIRRRELAGGQIVEQAIHLIDLYRYLVGEVYSVYATYTERGRNTREDEEQGFKNWTSYSVIFKFRNDIIGVLYSTYALYPKIFTDERGYHIMVDFICREMLVRYIHPREVRIYRRNQEVESHTTPIDFDYRMYDCFIRAVETGDKGILRTHYEDSFMTNIVALAANESAITGRVIKIEEFLSSHN
ncbi:MAG: hypothetical protein DRJ49_04465 [Thermoprotei archaeon]|nr:MAG: hypothetical protein DRN53_06475 [Thermoprotei archaeon]RLE88809.1 MAG: hypothetical protein DRJ49_04465 [Thermoprotei archaeon]